ncbi:MAG: Spo0B domain-containing protein [Syntrophomonadaceae bacterium]|nr:Spo0B domain-containing protein [Syntrophomonadaceae bacterium]MDD3272075.1 Spo0B domain-containing protein [Syntrophomonadaceae bacterium]MDD4562298.1 Spo0B domain-containing protein [Syntrophomonadaceae bacterium]
MEAEQALAILRRVRHDFGNYLQVILGYIDLDRPEQAKRYLLDIVEELATERNIFESLDAEAALYFYQQLLRARDLGIILKYRELQVNSWTILKMQNQPFNTLASLSPEFNGMDDDPIIYLSFLEGGAGVTMLFEWEEPRAGTLKVIVEELK